MNPVKFEDIAYEAKIAKIAKVAKSSKNSTGLKNTIFVSDIYHFSPICVNVLYINSYPR